MLDASAMIAYLRGEPGAEVVEVLLVGPESCIAHAVNLCEVYYKFVRASGESVAGSAIQDLKDKGLIVNEVLDQMFWMDAARYKAALQSVPLADCFVVALANRASAEVVTTDREDFGPMQERGICQVRFIR